MQSMRKFNLSTLLLLLLSVLSNQVFAQRTVGFFPNWRNAGTENSLQYDKITDIVYCFIQPASDGTFPALGNWPAADQTKFNNIKAKCSANGVRIHISSGGAGSASMYSPLAANATYRQNLGTSVASFIYTNGIDGFDIDWEFPSPSETGNLVSLVSAIRSAMDVKSGATGYRHMELGLDVGGENAHTAYCSPNVYQYLDMVNIMAYDIPNGFSTLALSKTAFNSWKSFFNNQSDKLILGVPFYTAGGNSMYSDIASPYSTNAANAYNGNLSGSDGSTYNAQPTLKQKVDYVMTNGGKGMMVWELSQGHS